MDHEEQDSDGSSDEMALENEESRLYGLVYHSSNAYDINPAPLAQPIITKSPVQLSVLQYEQFRGSKTSRMNNVQEIINRAEYKEAYINCIENRQSMNNPNSNSVYVNFVGAQNNARKQNVSAHWPSNFRENPLHKIKQTAIKKSSIGAGKGVKKSGKVGGSVKRITSNDGIKSFSFDLSTHRSLDIGQSLVQTNPGNLFSPFNFNYINSRNASAQIFRLDDRLFSKYTTNMTSIPTVAAAKNARKNRIRKEKKRKVRLEKVAEIKKVLKEKDTVTEVIDLDVKLPSPKKEVVEIISVDEVIILDDNDDVDSKPTVTQEKPVQVVDAIITVDSDSDESVCVMPVPVLAPPTIIAVEDNSCSEDEPLVKKTVIVKLIPDTETDNSFDFLDNTFDTDAMALTQAKLLSKLISNHGSKESLLDEGIFQTENVRAANTAPPNQDDNVSSSAVSVDVVHQPEDDVVVICSTPPVCHTPNDNSIVISQPLENDDPDIVEVEIITPDKMPKSPGYKAISPACEPTSTQDSCSNIELLDYINTRIAKRKQMHQFKVPKSNHHIVTKQARALQSEEVIGDDVVAIHSGTMSSAPIEDIVDSIYNRTSREVVGQSKREKREERKRRRLEEGDTQSSNKRSRTDKSPAIHRSVPATVYTKIFGEEFVTKEMTPPKNPTSWTKEMRRFYNDSWGGEKLDIRAVQNQMPANPVMWRLSRADLQPWLSRKVVRCHNCQHTGHISVQCSKPRTQICCMCGSTGHSKERCPNSICLGCGMKSRTFVYNCGQCRSHAAPDHAFARPQTIFKRPGHPTMARPQTNYNRQGQFNMARQNYQGTPLVMPGGRPRQMASSVHNSKPTAFRQC